MTPISLLDLQDRKQPDRQIPDVNDQTSSSQFQYRHDIDGLRALAIVPVVLFHADPSIIPGGFIGVDVFFVISGYLIGSLIYREMKVGNFTLRRFYERRAKRILPALFSVLAASLVAGCVLLSGIELKAFGVEMMSTLTSTSNIYFALKSDYFARSADLHPLLMTWSLGVEEQFYIFFPFLMYLLCRLTTRYVLSSLIIVSAVSFAISLITLPSYSAQTFYLLPSRAWELGFGTIIGVYMTTHLPLLPRRQGLLEMLISMGGVGLLLFGMFQFSHETLFPGTAALIPTVATGMLLISGGSWINQRILASKPFVWIGLVSYSWYLWHWPMMSFARICMAGELPSRVGLCIVAISLGLAIVSYFVVEQPARKATPARKSLLVRYGALTAAFVFAALLLLLKDGWQERFPMAAIVDTSIVNSPPDPCLAKYRQLRVSTLALCNQQGSSWPVVALLGDSHAGALAQALRMKAGIAGWRVEDFTKVSCPPLISVSVSIPNRPYHEGECRLFNDRAIDDVANEVNVKMVILAGYWTAPFAKNDNGERLVRQGEDHTRINLEHSWANFQMGLEQTVQLLQSHGERVMLVEDNPRIRVDPVLAARTAVMPARQTINNALGGPALITTAFPESDLLEPADLRANEILRKVALQTGASIIDLPAGLCPASMCISEQSSNPFYIDYHHLSFAGAQFALRNINIFEVRAESQREFGR